MDAVLVSDEPPNYAAIRSDINWIVRLNHGWNPNGTIPIRSGYADYAKRCADFVAHCKGANIFVISNEPNHAQEHPHGVKIEPEDYADCFNLCYQEIKQLRSAAQVLTAAIAPWDITGGIDWLAYYGRMLNAIDACDGLAVHGYTHGADPDLIWSQEKTHGWYWHFPVIYQTIKAIPAKFANLPVHVTETNQGDNAWVDRNSGWVQEAYNSIEGHNGLDDSQKILSLSLYRWRGDKWEIHYKNGVIDDFRAAVAKGYQSPSGSPILPGPTPPSPEPPITPPAPGGEYLIQWDKRLDLRGTTHTVALNGAGEAYAWHVTVGQWFDEAQAQGRHNCYIAVFDEHGHLIEGLPVKWFWDSGYETKKTEVKSDPFLGGMYSLDFGMYQPAPSYGFVIADGAPSDTIGGLGLGDLAAPEHKIHTSYYFEIRKFIVDSRPDPTPEPPITPGRLAPLLWPVSGPITDYFGSPPERFGMPGHNGIDIACRLDSPVVAVADGEVVFTGFDDAYGYYVRVWHPALHFHSFYAHLSEFNVYPGDRVGRGDLIAISGNTGNSTGPHLHLELRGGTRDGYYNVTYGYPQGRFDPRAAYLLTGAPLDPGAAR